jgi:Domain of unknown function (DUF5069)
LEWNRVVARGPWIGLDGRRLIENVNPKGASSAEKTVRSDEEASMKTDLEKVRRLAKDLRKGYPRSPREKMGGYVIAARCADKCRAFLLDMNGEYNYWPCSLASQWFAFTGITPDQFKDVVATGATDEELAQWIGKHSKIADPDEVLKWNNRMRDTRLSDMSLHAQQYLEEYIPQFVPNHRPVYVWFDVYDLEEKRF